jgi:DNA-binding FadR family transcriptional regulator
MSRDDIFRSIRSPNPLEETMERIAGAIKARLLSPGDRLPAERELAAQLGVSRSTLRVALQNLVQAGWLEVRRGRSGGAFVARWPLMPHPRRLPEVLTQHREGLPALLDYRRAVESAAAAFAAERATPAESAQLEAFTGAIDGASTISRPIAPATPASTSGSPAPPIARACSRPSPRSRSP